MEDKEIEKLKYNSGAAFIYCKVKESIEKEQITGENDMSVSLQEKISIVNNYKKYITKNMRPIPQCSSFECKQLEKEIKKTKKRLSIVNTRLNELHLKEFYKHLDRFEYTIQDQQELKDLSEEYKQLIDIKEVQNRKKQKLRCKF